MLVQHTLQFTVIPWTKAVSHQLGNQRKMMSLLSPCHISGPVCWKQPTSRYGVQEEEIGISFPKSLLHVMETCFPGEDWTPANEKQWTNSLFCIVYMYSLCISHWNVFISTQEFSVFYSWSSLTHPTGGKRAGDWVASFHLGINHNRIMEYSYKNSTWDPWKIRLFQT